MKKVIVCMLAAVSMLFASEYVNAQKVSFGAKAGLNLSTWNVDDYEFKPGFHAGGYANFKFNRMFAIQPEVLYSMEGTQYKFEESNTILGKEYYAKSTSTYTNHKIAVPVMLQFSPISRFTIEAGPQFNFNMFVFIKGEFETNVPGVSNYSRNSDTEAYNVFEFAVAGGVKFDLTNNMSIGARYVYGVTPLFSEVWSDGVISETVKTSNIMISFNYGF